MTLGAIPARVALNSPTTNSTSENEGGDNPPPWHGPSVRLKPVGVANLSRAG
jgi:hypothetical protein